MVISYPGRSARPLYKGVVPFRPAVRIGRGAGLLLCLWALQGCGALRLAEPADPMVTGSVKVQHAALTVPEGEAPTGIAPGDWAQAKLALDMALASPDKAASIPWDNPKTGSRGTATPIGTAATDGCREFRIGVVGASGEQWVQGAACKDGKGALSLSQVRVLGRA